MDERRRLDLPLPPYNVYDNNKNIRSFFSSLSFRSEIYVNEGKGEKKKAKL